MDLFAINGEPLNGSGLSVVTASLDFGVSVDVQPSAVRIVLPQANLSSGSADFAITPTFIQAASADAGGPVNIGITPKLTQAAQANTGGTVDILAAVLRVVPVTLDIGCTAQFIVIPASTLGAANIVGNSDLAANATKIQPAAAAVAGTVAVSAAPKVTRYVSAAIAGTAALRVEAKQNNKVDAFADVGGTLNFSMPDTGIVQRQAGAAVVGFSDFGANVSYIYNAQTTYFLGTLDISASPATVAIPFSAITPTANIVANATRVVPAAANFSQGAADVGAPAVQNFAVTLDVGGQADFVVNARRTAPAAVDMGGAADVGASAVAMRMAQAALDPSASVVVNAVYNANANVALNPSANVVPAPVAIRMATVNGVCTADFIASATNNAGAFANIVPTATFTANGVRGLLALVALDPAVDINADARRTVLPSVLFDATVDFDTNPRTNADAIDPPERTFYRPFVENEFRRPYIETELRRA